MLKRIEQAVRRYDPLQNKVLKYEGFDQTLQDAVLSNDVDTVDKLLEKQTDNIQVYIGINEDKDTGHAVVFVQHNQINEIPFCERIHVKYVNDKNDEDGYKLSRDWKNNEIAEKDNIHLIFKAKAVPPLLTQAIALYVRPTVYYEITDDCLQFAKLFCKVLLFVTQNDNEDLYKTIDAASILVGYFGYVEALGRNDRILGSMSRGVLEGVTRLISKKQKAKSFTMQHIKSWLPYLLLFIMIAVVIFFYIA